MVTPESLYIYIVQITTAFSHMEENRVLDPLNESHLFCLHCVFLPRVNKHLKLWKEDGCSIGYALQEIKHQCNCTYLVFSNSQHRTSLELHDPLSQVTDKLI